MSNPTKPIKQSSWINTKWVMIGLVILVVVGLVWSVRVYLRMNARQNVAKWIVENGGSGVYDDGSGFGGNSSKYSSSVRSISAQIFSDVLSVSMKMPSTRNKVAFDLTPLAQLPALKSLHLEHSPSFDSIDLSPVSNMNTLESLVITGGRRDGPIDLKPIEKLENLKSLYLDGRVKDLAPLSNFKQLESLHIRGYSNDLTPLAKMSQLKSLMFYTRAESIELADLSELTNLKTLWLIRINDLYGHTILPCSTKVDLANLSNMKQLNSLTICGNAMDFTPLDGLDNLSVINIFATEIGDVTPLAKLKKLNRLALVVPQVDDAQMSALQTAKPNLEIEIAKPSGDY